MNYNLMFSALDIIQYLLPVLFSVCLGYIWFFLIFKRNEERIDNRLIFFLKELIAALFFCGGMKIIAKIDRPNIFEPGSETILPILLSVWIFIFFPISFSKFAYNKKTLKEVFISLGYEIFRIIPIGYWFWKWDDWFFMYIIK